MRNIRLTIQYDGTDYYGWQRQTNTHRTIQEIIEKVLRKILQERVNLVAAGRTDAGVHAKGQIANFKTRHLISLPKLQNALNSLLPADIKISRVKEVGLDFHSQYNAKSKTYRYIILNRSYPCVFLHNQVYFYPYFLDIKTIQKDSRFLVGRHDFSSFRNGPAGERTSNVRDIKSIKIKKKGSFIYIDITASGFLRNMARNIVGTLIQTGRGNFKKDDLRKILLGKDRRMAGPTAPAKGLSLLRVNY